MNKTNTEKKTVNHQQKRASERDRERSQHKITGIEKWRYCISEIDTFFPLNFQNEKDKHWGFSDGLEDMICLGVNIETK